MASEGPHPPRPDWSAVRFTPSRAQAEDWLLALTAEGHVVRMVRDAAGFALWVPLSEADRASASLDAYDRENVERRRAARRVASSAADPRAALNAALAAVTAMILFYAVTGPRDPDRIWFERGSADAARIVAGEAWRCVTALTLHADLAHLVGNAIFGGFFLAALGRNAGPGLALLLALSAGAGGNALNAALRSTAHVSVGASTAVFGALGVLCGIGVVQRRQRGEGWRRIALPIAGGLGLLAMLGSAGERVDLWAHLLGLAVGVVIGIATGQLAGMPPRPWVQWLCAAGGVALVAASWVRALA